MLLSAAATRVQADLRGTTGKPWTCSVDADYLLQVSDGVASERVLLEAEDEDEDEDWFAPPGASPEQLNGGLTADADEAVASETTEALRSPGEEWPVCPEHRRVTGVCEGWWYCEGEPYHDVAEVGSLASKETPSS